MQRTTIAALAVSLALVACEGPHPTAPAGTATADARAALSTTGWTVVARGLDFPRGIAFGAEGVMYVAEAGTPQGNTESTAGVCPQVPTAPGPGPWLGGATSRISRIDRAGLRTTLVGGLASAVDAFGDVEGASDVAWLNGHLYAMVSAGCAHGHRNWPSSVIRVNGDGTFARVADLSTWLRAHPAAQPEPDDFEPDGSWYSMIAANGALYAAEANQGNLVRVQPTTGVVTRVADVSATQGHVVPTAVAWRNGQILVGELTPFPSVPGSAHVLRFMPDGRLDGAYTGFTAVLGVATDRRGSVYVLESFTCPTTDPCFPSPGSGRVTRVATDGARTVIARGLSFATSLRLGPDGALYVSNFGYGPPGVGQIVRIPLG